MFRENPALAGGGKERAAPFLRQITIAQRRSYQALVATFVGAVLVLAGAVLTRVEIAVLGILLASASITAGWVWSRELVLMRSEPTLARYVAARHRNYLSSLSSFVGALLILAGVLTAHTLVLVLGFILSVVSLLAGWAWHRQAVLLYPQRKHRSVGVR